MIGDFDQYRPLHADSEDPFIKKSELIHSLRIENNMEIRHQIEQTLMNLPQLRKTHIDFTDFIDMTPRSLDALAISSELTVEIKRSQLFDENFLEKMNSCDEKMGVYVNFYRESQDTLDHSVNAPQAFPQGENITRLILSIFDYTSVDECLETIGLFENLQSLSICELDNRTNYNVLRNLPEMPQLQELAVSGRHGNLTDIVWISKFTSLTKLEISGRSMTAEELRLIADHIPTLKELRIPYSALSNTAVEALGIFTNLEVLDCSFGEFLSDQAISAIGNMIGLKQLEIRATNTGISSKLLKECKTLPLLEELKVRGRIVPEKKKALVQHVLEVVRMKMRMSNKNICNDFPSLKKLDVHHWSNEFDALENCTSLTEVLVYRAPYRNDFFQILGKMTSVQSLLIEECVFDNPSKLQSISQMTSLRELRLNRKTLDEEGWEHLSQLPNLRTLRIEGGQYIRAFKVAQLQSLTTLDVRLFGEDLRGLLSMKNLNVLRLQGSVGLTDENLQILSQLDSLEKLTISNTPKITETGVKNLQLKKPHLKIQLDNCLRVQCKKLKNTRVL